MVISLLLISVYAHYLAPSDLGLIALLNVLHIFVTSILTLGIDGAMMRYYLMSNSEDEKNMYLSTTWHFLLFINIIFVCLAFIFGPFFFSIFLPDIPFKTYGTIVVSNIALSFLYVTTLTLFKTQDEAKKYSLYKSLVHILQFALITLFVVKFKRGVLGKLEADLIFYFTSGIIFTYAIRKNITFNISYDAISKLLHFGLPLLLHSSALWILNLSDRYILKLYCPLETVGLYHMAYSFSIPISLVALATINAWYPKLFDNKIHGGRPHINYSSTFFSHYIAIILFFTLSITIYASEILLIFTTPAYYKAEPVLCLSSISFLFYALYLVPSCVFKIVEKTKQLSFLTLIAALLNIILNFLWIPKWGAMGAVSATLCAFITYFLMTYYVANKYYPIKFEYRKIAIFILTALLIYLLSRMIHSYPFFLKVILKMFFLGLFVFMAYIACYFEVFKEQIMTIRLFLKRITKNDEGII